jgi:uncharacterized protein YggE
MNPKLILIPLVAGLAFLAVACDGGDTYVSADTTGQTGVTASGTGTAVGEPDVMVLTVGVTAQRDDVAAAREAAASAQTAVIDALKANGVKDEDIQTIRFSVNPQYDYSKLNGQGEIVGYVVSNVVSAKVRDLDKAGDAIDAATLAGGDDAVVQGVSFTIDDPTALQEQAREEAVQKAHDQAEQLASNAGAKLGKLVSISESSYYPINERAIPAAAGGVSSDAAVETPIETGQLEVSVTVNVLYAIE